jgi:hypothetical protein
MKIEEYFKQTEGRLIDLPFSIKESGIKISLIIKETNHLKYHDRHTTDQVMKEKRILPIAELKQELP